VAQLAIEQNVKLSKEIQIKTTSFPQKRVPIEVYMCWRRIQTNNNIMCVQTRETRMQSTVNGWRMAGLKFVCAHLFAYAVTGGIRVWFG